MALGIVNEVKNLQRNAYRGMRKTLPVFAVRSCTTHYEKLAATLKIVDRPLKIADAVRLGFTVALKVIDPADKVFHLRRIA